MGFELGLGFIDRLSAARTGAFAHLEDFADRLSHFFSAGVILMLAGVTMANVYFLRPISCTLPTAPDGKFNEFAEAICWVRGTVGLNEEDQMPNGVEDWDKMREKADISFYQWVPFCLSIQAMMFYLPHALWQSFVTHKMGDDLDSILNKAKKASLAENKSSRCNCVETAAYQLFRLSRQHQDNRSNRWARFQRYVARVPGGSLCAAGKRMGNLISAAYILIKLLYLGNAIGQLYIIKIFLGFHDNLFVFGDTLIGTLRAKREWGGSEFFPRQTYCPVSVRNLGTNNNIFTAICALPVNMFNEKIYIFLWLWIAVVAIVTALSLVFWLIRLSLQSCQTSFIKTYLISTIRSLLPETDDTHGPDCEACNIDINQAVLDRFVHDCVRSDGFFLLRMIRSNAGDVVTGEILNHWWHLFVQHEKAECQYFEKLKQSLKNSQADEKMYGFNLQDKHPNLLPPDSGLFKQGTNFV